jgi:hypothetical protein
MTDKTALPSEVAAFQAEVAEKAARREKEVVALIDRVLKFRDEPQLVIGGWAMFWQMMERAREEGIVETAFHPNTAVVIGGGLKGFSAPADYEEQMRRFLGPIRRPRAYGMSELSGRARACEVGVYHWPQWMVLLMVDETGEKLLHPAPDGKLRGRLAAFDLGWEGLWGGVASGDQVTADFKQCPCGRPGPTIQADIVRYSELSAAGDDKLTCGGTVEAYIRGMVGA